MDGVLPWFLSIFLEMVCHHQKGGDCWLFGLDLTLINFNQLIDVLMITNLLFNY